jgi:quinol monooxygenase YgiN
MKILGVMGAVALSCLPLGQALSAPSDQRVVRIAQLEIVPSQLEAYHAAVKEEMAESVRVEPGVIAIYAVAEKDYPNRLHFFEIYASDAAYKSHIASSHFQKYFSTTQSMIISKRLIEADPVQLSVQP